MRKSVGFLFIIIITTMLNGCILSKSPNTSSVAVTIGEQKIFTLSVFPPNATFDWTLDGAPVTGQGKSYKYTATGGEHSLRVTAAHFLGTDKETWTIKDGFPSFVDMTFDLEHRGPGTETNYIVAHDNRLFATVSVWNASDMTIPVTILRKDSPTSDWSTDFMLPQNEIEYHTRSECMARVTFTTDYTGTPLAQPVMLLILGAGQQSIDSDHYPFRSTVWTRIAAGNWQRTIVSEDVERPCDNSLSAGVRSLYVYRDAVQNRDILFIGTTNSQIYRAGYDPTAPGLLRVEPLPVFQGSGRVMSLRGTPYGLFASVSEKDVGGECSAQPGLPEGLIRYIDGTTTVDIQVNPLGAFEHVDTWESDHRSAEDSCRGLTLLPHPSNAGELALFGGLEDPGHIVYWENLATTPKRVLELDVLEYLGSTLNGNWSGVRIGPYNEFTTVSNPYTSEQAELIGLYVLENIFDTSSYFLVRHRNGSYESVKIASPDGRDLRGTRTIAPSPWPEDGGRVFYFGGFDGHGGPHTETAWIIKGTIPD
jgi:hypothetical protein